MGGSTPHNSRSHRNSDQACLEHGREDAAVLHWQALVGAGLIRGNPPPSPEIVPQREGNGALFRRIATDRRRLAREWRA